MKDVISFWNIASKHQDHVEVCYYFYVALNSLLIYTKFTFEKFDTCLSQNICG